MDPPGQARLTRFAPGRLGAETAEDLVSELQTMGLSAVQAVGQPEPPVGDALRSIRAVPRSASRSGSVPAPPN